MSDYLVQTPSGGSRDTRYDRAKKDQRVHIAGGPFAGKVGRVDEFVFEKPTSTDQERVPCFRVMDIADVYFVDARRDWVEPA